MRRFLVLALLTVFVFGFSGAAQAVELKAKGSWRVHFNAIKNPTFDKDEKWDTFAAMQRMRTNFDFIASENLKGVLQLEIGDITWGGEDGGALADRAVNIKTRYAYIDFKLPGTNMDFRAGRQDVTLPSTLGSHILEDDVAAMLTHLPFNEAVGLTLGWARAYDHARVNPDDITKKWDDEVDVFLGVLPISLDGINLNPIVVYSRWGKDFNLYELDNPKNANMWHAGLNIEVSLLDPVSILGDVNYGQVTWAEDFKQSGWIGALAVQYAMDMMTPEVFFLYESGEGADFRDGRKSKRMPVIGTDGGSVATGIGYGGATEFADDNFVRGLLAEIDPMGYQADEGAVGLWAVGAALRDITFIEDLSHEFVVSYARGTNHKDNLNLMTTKDSYWEVDFNTNWRMYENLALVLELAYGKLKLDDMNIGRSDLAKDALYRGALGFVYDF
ncbi:outer membrane homotrimeric porin [Desulfonatronum sp. SC1]|uniref:outer membrane homotrimeric porin n=1 Tax=Desulfonatronum sp. SC1 TaxID=2109626 RepID=UPI000D2F6327|nr:outer membrane homotrimeric porin [Desulfonatronum sp. SC1]PTN38450.1 hypothetical protein C6366_02530 [Desulfonatronum sp. SC1]